MLRLPAGIVIAIVVHLTIAAWLATRHPATPPPQPPTAVAVVTPWPIEIALLDDAPVPEESAQRVAPRAQATAVAIARDSQRVAAPRAGVQPVADGPASDATPPHRLAMRGGNGKLDLSPHHWDALEHVPAGTVAQPVAPEPVTTTRADVERATETETFAIDVGRDGTAHVHDKRNLHLNVPTKKKLLDWLGEGVDPGALQPGDGSPTATVPPIGVTIAKFDITDFAMRLHGDDPYAAEKLRALDATRDQRVGIGAKHEHDQLARASWLVQSNLDHLWDAIRDPTARKRALFELWDECAETGSQDLVEAGASARARVVKLIRTKLPAGSLDAFTAAELDAFNREKQSRAQFAPYD